MIPRGLAAYFDFACRRTRRVCVKCEVSRGSGSLGGIGGGEGRGEDRWPSDSGGKAGSGDGKERSGDGKYVGGKVEGGLGDTKGFHVEGGRGGTGSFGGNAVFGRRSACVRFDLGR